MLSTRLSLAAHALRWMIDLFRRPRQRNAVVLTPLQAIAAPDFEITADVGAVLVVLALLGIDVVPETWTI